MQNSEIALYSVDRQEEPRDRDKLMTTANICKTFAEIVKLSTIFNLNRHR